MSEQLGVLQSEGQTHLNPSRVASRSCMGSCFKSERGRTRPVCKPGVGVGLLAWVVANGIQDSKMHLECCGCRASPWGWKAPRESRGPGPGPFPELSATFRLLSVFIRKMGF